MGYVRVGAQACLFVSTLIAGRLFDHGVSYRVLFPVAGVLGLLAAYAFSKVKPLANLAPSTEPTERVPLWRFTLDTLTILRDNLPYRWFAASVMTYGFGNLMAIPVYALYQVDSLHISSAWIANLTNFASLWSIAGMFFWGRFMDKRGAPVTVLLAICCIMLIPVVYLTTHSIPGLLFASALSGFGFAGIELSYMASILQYAQPGRVAQYQALHSFLLGVRGVLAPLIGIPLMNRFGFKTVFALALVIMFAGAVMQWLAARAQRTSANEAA
jgi:MFS family permease